MCTIKVPYPSGKRHGTVDTPPLFVTERFSPATEQGRECLDDIQFHGE